MLIAGRADADALDAPRLAQATNWVPNGDECDGRTSEREGRTGRDEHDSHSHPPAQLGGPGWNRPRCAVNDALPQWDAGPRGTAPGSERLARRSGTPFANTVNAPPPPRVGLSG